MNTKNKTSKNNFNPASCETGVMRMCGGYLAQNLI